MNKELNFICPETAKIIYLLGIRWKASSYWQFVPGQKKYILKDKLEPFKQGYPAYNVSEIGHIIPFGFFNEMKLHKYLNGFFKIQVGEDLWETYASEAEARAHYLIYLLRSKKANIRQGTLQDNEK